MIGCQVVAGRFVDVAETPARPEFWTDPVPTAPVSDSNWEMIGRVTASPGSGQHRHPVDLRPAGKYDQGDQPASSDDTIYVPSDSHQNRSGE